MSRFLPRLQKRAFRLICLFFLIFVFSPNALAQIRTDPCEAYLELLRSTPPSDQKAGSLLFFAKYISDTTDPMHENTQLERLPRAIVASSFNSQLTHESTLVTFVPTPNLGFAVNDPSTISTLVYDDTARVRSTSFIMRAYRRTPLVTLRISEDLNNFVKGGRTGWIKLMTTGERPLLGAIFTRGPQLNGAMNFRHISLLKSYTITVPVI